MTFKSININENECFFCTPKDVKKYFVDTELRVSFKRAKVLKFFNHKGPKKSSLPVKKVVAILTIYYGNIILHADSESLIVSNSYLKMISLGFYSNPVSLTAYIGIGFTFYATNTHVSFGFALGAGVTLRFRWRWW